MKTQDQSASSGSVSAAAPAVVPPVPAVRAVLPFDNLRNSLEMSLSRLITQGQSADARAGMILSTNIAMLGALVATVSASKVELLSPIAWACAMLAFMGGAMSIAQVAYAAFPRAARGSETVLFFGALAHSSHEAYNAKMRSMQADEYIDDLTHQCHSVAHIVNLKFRSVRSAFILLFAAIVPWMGAIAGVSKHF